MVIAGGGVEALLARNAVGTTGLYRTDPVHNLTAAHAAMVGAFEGRGPVELGRSRRLAVIAVDGLGFAPAVATLTPDLIGPLTSEFPTTTMACLLTSLTGRPAGEHGYVGVQYLDDDGRRSVNCHTGNRDEPTSAAAARPTVTPAFPTAFATLMDAGVATMALPNELGQLHDGIRGRLFQGCESLWPPLLSLPPQSPQSPRPSLPRPLGLPLPPLSPGGEPCERVAAFAAQLTAAVGRSMTTVDGPALVWGYLDLDTYIHRHGVDRSIEDACRAVDRLARDLARAGTAVILFSDHGLTANQAAVETEANWRDASSPRWCRLPAGGAGRIRWLYPHADRSEALLNRLAGQRGDMLVLTQESLAANGFLAPDSIGARRLGEIVLIATGPDFPAPATDVAYEHGSMTADEIVVPLAVWQPDR